MGVPDSPSKSGGWYVHLPAFPSLTLGCSPRPRSSPSHVPTSDAVLPAGFCWDGAGERDARLRQLRSSGGPCTKLVLGGAAAASLH